MSQVKTIDLNYFAYSGYRGHEILVSFKVWKAYEPSFKGKGRSVFRNIKTAIRKCYKTGAVDLNLALSEMTGGEPKDLVEVLGMVKHLPISRLDRITATEGDGLPTGYFDKSRKAPEDGNSINGGMYSVARKILEDDPSY